jgi:hypothetical protein
MNGYLDKHMTKLHAFLTKWEGCHAKIWSYQTSHTKLVIRIQKSGVSGNLHVTCMGTQHVTGPAEWDNCHITVAQSEQGGLSLADEAAGVEVLASTVDVAENVSPLY